MNPVSKEILHFLYCVLAGLAGILALAFVVDLISLLVAWGWRWELGSFPAVSGTFRALTDSGWFYTTALLLGFGGIARMIWSSKAP